MPLISLKTFRVFQNKNRFFSHCHPPSSTWHSVIHSHNHLQAWQVTLISHNILSRTFSRRPHNPCQNPRRHFHFIGVGTKEWSHLPSNRHTWLMEHNSFPFSPVLCPKKGLSDYQLLPLSSTSMSCCILVCWANLFLFQQASGFILGLYLTYVRIPLNTKSTPQSLPSQNKYTSQRKSSTFWKLWEVTAIYNSCSV